MVTGGIRIDRVIRVTLWNQQTVSLLVHDGRLYLIRTGVLAAAATGSVLTEGSMLVAGWLFGAGEGGGERQKGVVEKLFKEMADEAADNLRSGLIQKVTRYFERSLTTFAGKAAAKREALISPDNVATMATGWMSANIALADITSADVSETATQRVDGMVPQIWLRANGKAITLRFPQMQRATVDALATFLLAR